MNVIVINGSPHGNNGNTGIMIESLLHGMVKGKADATDISLADKNINHCKGCYSCWINTPGTCVIRDDMAEIIPLFMKADLIVLASPVYFNNITGLMKNFIDRLTAIGGNPKDQKTANNKEDKKTGFVMVSNCGFPDKSQFDVISLWINKVVTMLKSDLLVEIYLASGNKLKEDNNDVELYLSLLEVCGNELAKNGRVSDKNLERLKKLLI